MKKIKVGVVHLADVRNYGDVLFPLLIGQEISRRLFNVEISYVSATGSKWAPLPNAFRIDQIDLDDFDMIILAGGEVVHLYDEMLRGIYARFNEQFIPNPTDLIFTWTKSKAKFKVWLSVGVPIYDQDPLLDPRNAILSAVDSLDYLGIRGSNSLFRVSQLDTQKTELNFTPDLGWIFPRLLNTHKQLLIQKPSQIPNLPIANFIVIQSIWNIPKEDIEKICNWTLKKSLKIVLLPLTRCWGDENSLKFFHEYANQLGYIHTFIIDTNISDISKLEILSNCSMYVGESLHGFVSAASFGIRSGIVAKPQPDKFDEIMKDNGLEEFKVGSWDEIINLFENLGQADPRRFTQIAKQHSKTLDDELDRVCSGAARGYPLLYKISMFIRKVLN
jgi:hypothetical protein